MRLMNERKNRIFAMGDQFILQSMALAGVIYLLIFFYGPMYGIILAFKDYDFALGIMKSPYVGLANFRELLEDPELFKVLRNTISISLLKLAICFPAPILFAVLLNELPGRRIKKFIQTASFFPHFISWVIVSLLMDTWFANEKSLVNSILLQLQLIEKPLRVLTRESSFYGLAVFTELWKETGWAAIIYIAAIAGIDTHQYEAAAIDGASRLQRIFRITIPNLQYAITIMFMFSFAGILSGGGGAFEQSFFFGNTVNYDRSIILGTYVLKTGIQLGRFSFATAVGLMNSFVSMGLLVMCNAILKRTTGSGIYRGGDA